MPLYLTNSDIAPLLDSDEELGRALTGIEDILLKQHNDPPGHFIFSGVPLTGEDQMMALVNSNGTDPVTVRVFAAGWNQHRGTTTSVMLLLDPVTGSLQAVVEADDLNRLRTALPAAMGAKHLARPGARVLGMLGSGDQARGTVRTIIQALPSIEEVVVWSPTPENRERFADEQSRLLNRPVRAVGSSDDVVRAADVLMLAGRMLPGAFAFDASLLKPGTTVLSMSAAAPRSLIDDGGLYVPTTRRPIPVAIGFTGNKTPRPMADPERVRVLADVLAGGPARENDDEILLWELAQIYLWDQAIAGWVLDWARRSGAGTRVGDDVGQAV